MVHHYLDGVYTYRVLNKINLFYTGYIKYKIIFGNILFLTIIRGM